MRSKLWISCICDNIASFLEPSTAVRFATINVECKMASSFCRHRCIHSSHDRYVVGVLQLLSKNYGSIEEFLQLRTDRRMDLCSRILLDLSDLLLLGSNLLQRHQLFVGDRLIFRPGNTKMYEVRFSCWIPSAGLLWALMCDSIVDRRERRLICYDL